MTRSWWIARLLRPSGTDDFDRDAEVLLVMLPDVVARLRAVDGGAHWRFQRLDGRAGAGFGLSFYATAEALRDIAASVRIHARRLDWPLAAGADARDVPAHLELSTAASDFALALLRRGEPTVHTALPVAVRHLRHIVGRVAPDERRPFLFECWRHWSGGLAPGLRVKLNILADTDAQRILAEADLVTASEPWPAYCGALARLTGDDLATGAMKYVLFRIADATHNQLAIPPADQALAALVVRAGRLP